MDEIQRNELVEIVRTKGLEALVCQPLVSTTDCMVASEMSDSLDLDGLCLVPMRTIRYLDRAFDGADYYRAAIDLWPVDQKKLDRAKRFSGDFLADLHQLKTSGELVAIHPEVSEPQIAYVGKVVSVAPSEIRLERISARGDRLREPLSIEIAQITKVELCTRYLRAVDHAHRMLAARQRRGVRSDGSS